MAPPTDRSKILEGFRKQIQDGKPIIGAGAGIGLSAKFIEEGGGDMIVIYNSGKFRMAGHGSLAGLMPYSNANDIVVEMASECGTDPLRDIPRFIKGLKEKGLAGVQNFPTVGLIDGTFRINLEETGMGYDKEVEAIRVAHELDMLTTPYVFNAEDATAMAQAGADILVAHMGLTTSGSIGAKTGRNLEECVRDVQAIRDAGTKVNDQIIVLCHGGPIATPEDAKYMFGKVRGLHGFFGASSMERLPVEEAISRVTKQFKGLAVEQ